MKHMTAVDKFYNIVLLVVFGLFVYPVINVVYKIRDFVVSRKYKNTIAY